MIKNIKVTSLDEKTRIDRWLKRNFSSLSQSFIEKNLRKGSIKINNNKVKANYKVIKNDIINIYNFSRKNYPLIQIIPTQKKISQKTIKKFKDSIIFQNEDFIILNKWSSITTQGASKDISINDIINYFSPYYSLVHRLDKETSGLLIISKNLKITKLFAKLFKEQKIEKIYIAICQGVPKNSDSIVRLKIASKNKPDKFSYSITKYKVVLTKDKLSVILFCPLTGKTHQLRIVSKNLGCPILGDKKYNQYQKYDFENLKLNAYLLKFTLNGNSYVFKSKLPNHFYKFFAKQIIKTEIDKFASYFSKSL